MTIDSNYSEEYVDISMPEYVKKVLDRLKHPKPKRPQYAPHCWTVPAYGKRLQMAPDPDDSDLLDKKATKIIQYIVGTMLYYARSVDPTILRAINEIYKASNMVLHVDSDAAYLTMPEARSCYAGHFYLSNWP